MGAHVGGGVGVGAVDPGLEPGAFDPPLVPAADPVPSRLPARSSAYTWAWVTLSSSATSPMVKTVPVRRCPHPFIGPGGGRREEAVRPRLWTGCHRASGRTRHGMASTAVSVAVVAYGRLVQVRFAQQLAEVLLDEPDLRRRWAHVCGVARPARRAGGPAARWTEPAGELLVAAAWLHDIGYAHRSPPDSTRSTGPGICAGSAPRSRCAARSPTIPARRSRPRSAAARAELGRVPGSAGGVTDALWTCADMETSPAGDPPVRAGPASRNPGPVPAGGRRAHRGVAVRPAADRRGRPHRGADPAGSPGAGLLMCGRSLSSRRVVPGDSAALS